MATTLPAAATKDNSDSVLDDPELAILTDLAGVIDKYNSLRTALGASALLNIAEGLATASQAGGTPDDLRTNIPVSGKLSAYTITTTDRSKLIRATGAGGFTLSFTAVATLGDGWYCYIRNDSTGAITLDPNGSETIDGETTISLAVGAAIMVHCNGSLLTTIARTTESSLPRSYLAGLETANDNGDLDHDISITAGKARDDADSEDLALASQITKRIDATWAVGSNQGGLDTGPVAADTWYAVYLIKRTDTGVVDALFSTSFSSPTMPTNYDKKRRIGAVLTDASLNIVGFTQYGDKFIWNDIVEDVQVTNLGTTFTNYALSTPTSIQTTALITATFDESGGGAPRAIWVLSPDQNNRAPAGSENQDGNVTNSATRQSNDLQIVTNTSSQVKAAADVNNADLNIYTIGWIDRRGRDE